VVLVIVGDGSDFESVNQSIRNLQLSEHVILTGFIPEPDTVEFYANADVLIFPTYCNEGFPMGLFNSVAAGLSILTTRIRAANDYLTEPENCLWVEPRSSDSIYQGLDRLLSSETLMDEMKRKNIEKARLFSKKVVCAELSEIIETVNKN
jgi:glycosyltransferase involved in cell wall biosynthesis